MELIQNGTSIGKLTAGTRLAADLPKSFLFDLTYLPGTLEAVSYKDGKELSRDTLTTAASAKTIRLIPEKTELSANGHALAYIRIEIVDENGVVRFLMQQSNLHADVKVPVNWLRLVLPIRLRMRITLQETLLLIAELQRRLFRADMRLGLVYS